MRLFVVNYHTTKPVPQEGRFGNSLRDRIHSKAAACLQSQGDCVLQPRVARNELPWVRSPGFTLIEVVGVLAVIAILGSLLAPAVVSRIDQAAHVRDKTELSGMADALRSVVLRTGQIPGADTIVSVLANEMAVSASQVATNSRNVLRAFLVDPNLWIASSTGYLPYNQTKFPYGTGTNINGVCFPAMNLRLMIISSIGQQLPNTIDFNDAWATPDGAIPGTWPSSWTSPGRADDLSIQRVDLTPLFKRIILNPIDTTDFGSFAIENDQSVSVTNTVNQTITNSWYLQGTALRLCDASSGIMQMKAVVQNDASYVFENQAWRGQLSGWGTNGPAPYTPPSSSIAASLFTMWATNLIAAPLNMKATGQYGDSTMAILGDFYTFMTLYDAWGGKGPPPAALIQAETAITQITLDMSK